MLLNGIIKVKNESYLNLLVFLLPFLNFIVGINIDLYAPSLPAIADYYNVSIVVVKNTITITMVGFAIGCIFFGPLMDIYGRRKIILFCFVIYILSNFLTLKCHNIQQLMTLRFIQGLASSVFSIGSRALIIDNFVGYRLTTALTYTSIAYGLGPIIAPFIGGILQYNFGWKANFLAYAIFAMVVAIFFFLYIHENFSNPQKLSFKNIILNYLMVFKNKAFMGGVLISGFVQLEQMIYPTIGPFLIENELHKSSVIYGNSALIIGAGYLCGALVNRLFIKKFSSYSLIVSGFILLVIGLLLQIVLSIILPLNLLVIVIPIVIITFGTGLIFVNVLGYCLKMFPQNAGTAISVLTCLLMLIASIGVFIISQINITSLLNIATILFIIIMLQMIVFFTIFKPAITYKG